MSCVQQPGIIVLLPPKSPVFHLLVSTLSPTPGNQKPFYPLNSFAFLECQIIEITQYEAFFVPLEIGI